MVHAWRNVRNAHCQFEFCINDDLVYRVSWLRAKARFSRWSEELRLVEHEMRWTVNWFRWKEMQWKDRLERVRQDLRPLGFDCYCEKQIALWKNLGDTADSKFSAHVERPLFSID